MVDDGHAECETPFGDNGTDSSHADNSNRLALGVVSRRKALLPLARSSIDFALPVLPECREDQKHGGGCRGVIDSAGSVGDLDSTLGGRSNVDLIVPCTIVANEFYAFGESSNEISVKDADFVGRIVMSVDGRDVGVFALEVLEKLVSRFASEWLITYQSIRLGHGEVTRRRDHTYDGLGVNRSKNLLGILVCPDEVLVDVAWVDEMVV